MATKMKSRGNGTVKIGSIGGTAKAAKDKIKGISFGVVLAGKVHDGTKTVTRRVAKFRARANPVNYSSCKLNELGCWFRGVGDAAQDVLENVPVPYQVGQLLYVREPWRVNSGWDWTKPSDLSDVVEVSYNATDGAGTLGRYRQARFMPKRFARTFIRVTGLRCERLGEITEDDAVREGIDTRLHPDDGETVTWRDYRCTTRDKFVHGSALGPKESFLSLWDAVNGKDAHKENPWVWVIYFERVEMPNPWNSNQYRK